MRSLSSADLTPRPMSAPMRRRRSAGTPEGAMTPMMLMAEKPGTTSATSGISGFAPARLGLESASTFSRPSLTKGIEENSTSKSSGTRPPITSCWAGALPL